MTRRPKKSLGQNFLIDENIARKIAAHLFLEPDDHLLEIGPGQGMLTKYLLPHVRRLVAVELDRNLVSDLHEQFILHRNFELVEADFLKFPIEQIFTSRVKWKIVGNIPYHITSSIIFKILEHRYQVDTLTLMIQREVAERIVAQPNSKTYGIPSVISQLFADVKILFYVSNQVFFPKPKVESAVIQWRFLPEPRYPVADEKLFVHMVKTMFGQRRKIIRNTLKAMLDSVDSSDIVLTKRPEQLSLAELVHISNVISHGRTGPKGNSK
ncbi:ribosomal RNA small subunit methyltransferase A [candidate division KSB1 bacterium]|nr:ribosomal RNA small subunit methyltransferase A [candidate division KSB1 bacterium]